jgi:hypothetical protein
MPEETKPSTYCLVAKSSAAVGSCVTVTVVNPPNVSAVPPKEIFVVPREIIKDRELISIPVEFKIKSYNGFSLKEYENKIELLY